MRILIDTNILISAILFPKSKPAKALLKVVEDHQLVLSEQNLMEFREVIKRKAPEHLSTISEHKKTNTFHSEILLGCIGVQI